eukprot:gnl/Dysnectes_brevis/6694_a10573_436.p1 GENE.gnl/Dysnectes_brevis/6694_a10573_436~~gnl/Dysnectes_brevis/6694_a10573_436.p1  ORF type:complete len:183 (+),score=19.79 gnl/Dysnectes_brevis/6694_a10573_436:73-621(+)
MSSENPKPTPTPSIDQQQKQVPGTNEPRQGRPTYDRYKQQKQLPCMMETSYGYRSSIEDAMALIPKSFENQAPLYTEILKPRSLASDSLLHVTISLSIKEETKGFKLTRLKPYPPPTHLIHLDQVLHELTQDITHTRHLHRSTASFPATVLSESLAHHAGTNQDTVGLVRWPMLLGQMELAN